MDFDLHSIDLFEKQAAQELSLQDKIRIEFDQIANELGHIPSRMELFTGIDTGQVEAKSSFI